MDRPARKTKVVNYSEPKDFDDDDDFASVKAPPSKKAREDVKPEHKKPSSKSSSQESQSTPSQTSRKPPDVKLYERDLEAAITLSLLNNPDEIKDPSPAAGDVRVHVPADENTDPTSLHRSNCSVDLTVLGLDEITSERESSAPPRQRAAAAKAAEETKKKLPAEDEDYEPKLTPESESDDDFSEAAESDDEEFTVKKVSKTKKKEKVAKKEKTKASPVPKKEKTSKNKPPAAAARTPVRSPPAAKVAPKRPAPSSTVPSSRPAVSPSPAGGSRAPRWTPPAQVGKSPTSSSGPAVRSPGQGLRLGLSRRVRVKPLHPGVASH